MRYNDEICIGEVICKNSISKCKNVRVFFLTENTFLKRIQMINAQREPLTVNFLNRKINY